MITTVRDRARPLVLVLALVLAMPFALRGSDLPSADAQLNLGPNLLDHNESTIAYSANGWTEQGNTRIARTTAVSRGPGASLKVTVDRGGPWPDATRTARVGTQWGNQAKPAAPGTEYYGSVWVRGTNRALAVRCELRFFARDGSILATRGGASLPLERDRWTKRQCRAEAPARTAHVNIRVFAADAPYGEVFHLDDALLAEVLDPGQVPGGPGGDAVAPPAGTRNLLTGDRASFRGSVGGWLPQGNTTVSHAAGVGHSGDGALRVKVDSTGPWPDSTGTARAGTPWSREAYPVEARQRVFGSVWIRSERSSAPARCEIRFFSHDGTIVATVAGDPAPQTPGTWSQRVCSATAPAAAEYVNLRVFLAGTRAGEVYHVDDAFLGVVGASAVPPASTTTTTAPPPPATTAPPPPATTAPPPPPATTAPPPPPTTAPPPPPSSGPVSHGSEIGRHNTGYRALYAPDLGRNLRLEDLRVHNGDLTTTHNGQVIERVRVNGVITVAHDNVTIRGCFVSSPGNTDAIRTSTFTQENTTVEYCEITGNGNPNTQNAAVSLLSARVRFNDIHGISQGGAIRRGRSADRPTVYEYNYVHDIAYGPGSHNTSFGVNGASHVIVRYNHFADGNSAAFSIYGTFAPNKYIDVIGNYFDTPNAWYQVQAGYDPYKPYTNQSDHIRFIDNAFGSRNFAYPTVRTVWDGSRPGNVWRGNYLLANGAPA